MIKHHQISSLNDARMKASFSFQFNDGRSLDVHGSTTTSGGEADGTHVFGLVARDELNTQTTIGTCGNCCS